MSLFAFHGMNFNAGFNSSTALRIKQQITDVTTPASANKNTQKRHVKPHISPF